MTLEIILLFYVCPLAAILFIVRLLSAPFSSKVRAQMGKYPLVHFAWGSSTIIGLMVITGTISQPPWKSLSAERSEQRAKVLERVQAAGGWDAIRQGCVTLTEQNTNGFSSRWRDTNSLPIALATLKPMQVQYFPQNGCVRIRLFGIHSTGGHSTPYFGLEVDTSTNNTGYQHGTGYDNGGVIGNHHSTNSQVAQGIYEIF